MSGFEMFCERCGQRYGSDEATAASSLPLARRLLKAVGVGANAPTPPHEEPFLRFCLACRGYSCPACWNEDAGFCQTCVPLPEPEPVAVEPAPVSAEPDPAPVFAEPDPAPVSAKPDRSPVAHPERPVEVVYAEDASYTQPEPDVHWNWSLDPSPEPEAALPEPQPTLPEAPVLTELQTIPEAPVLPDVPPQPAMPIFRPLEPIGPILPPPPPPAASPPRMEFELPDAPVAFLLAQRPLTPQVRPTLPVDLFDGPGPQVRACVSCELPVSAKARFCRRCGSAQV